MSDMVLVPREALAGLLAAAAHVSYGRSMAFCQDRPYPDAMARRALGLLDDAGLLDRPKPEAVAATILDEPLPRDFARLPCDGWCVGDCPGCCACGTKRCSGCALGREMEELR